MPKDKLFAEIEKKILRVDREIRASHTGQPAAVVEPVARRAFARIGVNFKSMNDYAKTVEANTSFEIKLGG